MLPAQVTVIPTTCPKFLAACTTVGINLESGTPGVSNIYSKSRKYDRGEPGEISYFLSDKQGINPMAIAKVWHDPHPDLKEAVTLPQRLLGARTSDDLQLISKDLEALIVLCAAAHMSLFCSGRFALPSLDLTAEESYAVKVIDEMPAKIAKLQPGSAAKGKLAAQLCEMWRPCMIAWVKAWVANYRETRDVWLNARPAIRIERGDGIPLILPRGKGFAELLRRWA